MYCIILYKTHIFVKVYKSSQKMKTKFNLKKTILVALLLVAGSTATFAQCDKKATLTSSVTNYVNAKGEIERTKDEETVITVSKTELSITPGDEETMSGTAKTYSCNWKVPFKEGKTVITSTVMNHGREMNVTVTIEGKDGKVMLTFEALEMPGKKIQVVADKFE